MNDASLNHGQLAPPGRLSFAGAAEAVFRADYAAANLSRLRIGLWVAIGLYVVFLLVRLAQESGPAGHYGALLRLGIIGMLGATLLLSYRLPAARLTPVIVACYLLFGTGVTAIEVVAQRYGVERHYEGLLLISFHCFVFSGLLFRQACVTALLILLIYAVGGALGGLAGKPWAYQLLFMILTDIIGAVALYMIESRTRGEYLARQLLQLEKQKSDRLLASILPEPVAQRLKEGETHIADNFDRVSVVVADIVGFTALSAGYPPRQVVDWLNSVFTEFDQLAGELGLEKIKTIGDAYMAVAGLPTPRGDHAHVAATLALAMRERAARIPAPDGSSPRLHIGIHCGPVVAGVIGSKKFSYDLWGDTVNMASRLQAQAEPGTIVVSEGMWMRLTDRYRFGEARSLMLKGIGAARAFELLGPLH